MLAKAEARFVRVCSRKAQLVMRLVKGKSVEEANSILDGISPLPRIFVKKLINSAFANLNHVRKDKLTSKDVFISQLDADCGPMFKRYRAATMGRATPIRHRTAHLYVELDSHNPEHHAPVPVHPKKAAKELAKETEKESAKLKKVPKKKKSEKK